MFERLTRIESVSSMASQDSFVHVDSYESDSDSEGVLISESESDLES